MEKDEILKKAQKENKGRDVADLEAQRKGAYIAYFVGTFIIIVWDVVEGILYNRINYGGNFALFMMVFSVFVTKYVMMRKKHELIISILYGLGGLAFFALWIVQLCGVIA